MDCGAKLEPREAPRGHFHKGSNPLRIRASKQARTEKGYRGPLGQASFNFPLGQIFKEEKVLDPRQLRENAYVCYRKQAPYRPPPGVPSSSVPGIRVITSQLRNRARARRLDVDVRDVTGFWGIILIKTLPLVPRRRRWWQRHRVSVAISRAQRNCADQTFVEICSVNFRGSAF